MSKIKSCVYRHVVFTCLVNTGSVVRHIKIGRSKIGFTKEKINKWALKAKIGDTFIK
jgi:phosphosulfolactate phosphohydrolase-like enzyme